VLDKFACLTSELFAIIYATAVGWSAVEIDHMEQFDYKQVAMGYCTVNHKA
jgi:hypothetical protein